MNKVICDVCGTTYPETATQCPICGCVKPENANPVAEEGADAVVCYTYVKGGRFSKSNVRKRTRGGAVADEPRKAAPKENPSRKNPPRNMPPVKEQDMPAFDEDEEEEIAPAKTRGLSNGSLIVVLILLLIAIAAVVVYIVGMLSDDPAPENTRPSISQSGNQDDTGSGNNDDTQDDQKIPCTALSVLAGPIELTVGETYRVEVFALPENTTDTVSFKSDKTALATVDANGVVTAVAPGEVNITVTCGTVEKTCAIVCKEAGPAVPDNADDWKLNRTDFSLKKPGDSWKLFRGTTDVSLITFTSDNEKVVTFEDGVVKAVGKGRTKVHASYNGREFSCWVSVESW